MKETGGKILQQLEITGANFRLPQNATKAGREGGGKAHQGIEKVVTLKARANTKSFNRVKRRSIYGVSEKGKVWGWGGGVGEKGGGGDPNLQ